MDKKIQLCSGGGGQKNPLYSCGGLGWTKKFIEFQVDIKEGQSRTSPPDVGSQTPPPPASAVGPLTCKYMYALNEADLKQPPSQGDRLTTHHAYVANTS